MQISAINISAIVGKSLCSFTEDVLGTSPALGAEGNAEEVWALRKLTVSEGDKKGEPTARTQWSVTILTQKLE